MKRKTCLAIFSVFAISTLAAGAASAATPVWLSSGGTDSASCGAQASPCRTLSQSVSNVTAGGTILIANPGTYSSGAQVQVSKSLNIVNNSGGVASFAVTSNNNLQINGGDVVVDGLTFTGDGTAGQYLVTVRDSAGSVVLRNCSFLGGGNAGVNVTGAYAKKLVVANSVIKGNGNGIIVQGPSGGNASVYMTRDIITGNTNGLSGPSAGAYVPKFFTYLDNIIDGNGTNLVNGANPTRVSFN